MPSRTSILVQAFEAMGGAYQASMDRLHAGRILILKDLAAQFPEHGDAILEAGQEFFAFWAERNPYEGHLTPDDPRTLENRLRAITKEIGGEFERRQRLIAD